MTPPGSFFPPLDSLRVEVSECLAGGKHAVRQGSTVHVSPAMHALMKDATPEELARLLGSILLVEIPRPPTLAELSEMLLGEDMRARGRGQG